MYEGTDINGKKHLIFGSLVRLHKRHSVSTGHVTDNKIHNRYAMQHVSDHQLEHLETYLREYFLDDIPKGYITCLHQHSDNAGHFKNTGAIAYFTTLINDRGVPSETAFVVLFGAHGHGKGPFYGIGGRWENKLEQAMFTAEMKRLEFTDTSYSHGVVDVFKARVCDFSKSTKKMHILLQKRTFVITSSSSI